MSLLVTFIVLWLLAWSTRALWRVSHDKAVFDGFRNGALCFCGISLLCVFQAIDSGNELNVIIGAIDTWLWLLAWFFYKPQTTQRRLR